MAAHINKIMEKRTDKPKASVPKEQLTDEETDKIINRLLDRNFRIYDRLAEI